MEILQLVELVKPDRRVDVGHVVLEAELLDFVVPGSFRRVALPRVARNAVEARTPHVSTSAASSVVIMPPSPVVMFFPA